MDNPVVGECERLQKKKGRLDRWMMLLKLSEGMDDLPVEQKRRSVSFANAINAIEGVSVSEQAAKGLADWQAGKISYLSLFEATLRRYGFWVGNEKIGDYKVSNYKERPHEYLDDT